MCYFHSLNFSFIHSLLSVFTPKFLVLFWVKFDVLRINIDEITSVHYVIAKDTSLQDFVSFEPLSVKIDSGPVLYVIQNNK